LNSGVDRTSRGAGISGSFGINAAPESINQVRLGVAQPLGVLLPPAEAQPPKQLAV